MSAMAQALPLTRLSEAQKGVALAVLAHLVWGGMAWYFKQIEHIPPIEVAVHRGLWSVPVAWIVLRWLDQTAEVRKVAANPRFLAMLALTAGLIAFNWGVYVWSISVDRTLESSFGYYINPLLNVALGFLFLKERFTRMQLAAVGLAVVAVAIQGYAIGVLPWIGLMLAATFCLYGFIRKTIPVGPVPGFFIEVVIVSIPGLAYAVWAYGSGSGHFLVNLEDTVLLMGCGLMTSAALILYAASIKRIRYATAGLLQYISPSLVFLTAVFSFGEPMNFYRWLSFGLIWIGLVVFTVSALRQDKARRIREAEPAPL